MKLLLGSLFASFVLASSLAGQERFPVQGSARIAGRDVARFIVAQAIPFQSVAYDSTYRWHATVTMIPAAQYIPVSEDREGVYFQSTAGLGTPQTAEGKYPAGGLYVHKQRLGEVYAFFGEARGQGRLLRTQVTVPPDAQKRLLVAQMGQGKLKPVAKVSKS